MSSRPWRRRCLTSGSTSKRATRAPSPSVQRTSWAARSTWACPASATARTSSGARTIGRSPIFVQFELKMSAKLSAMIARKPESRAPRARARGSTAAEVPPRHEDLVRGRSQSGPAQSKNRYWPKPVRSMRLRNCLGMIWSVSTSSRSRTATRPVMVSMALSGHGAPLADVDEVALDRGGGGHLRADEVGAGAAALAALEVAVRGARDTLAGGGDVGVRPEAHRAAGVAPVEAGGAEHRVEALRLGLALDLHGARDDHRVDVGGHAVAVDHGGRGAQVADPEFVHEPMNTRSRRMSWTGVPGRRSM